MQIRCKTCHGSVWIQPNREIVQCPTCSQEYDLSVTLKRANVGALHRDARVLARKSDIDLPAACSVLLGIIKLDEVKDVCSRSIRPAAPATDGASFDPAFEAAVKAGCLTAEQAMQRGDREALARRLAARHGLPLERALAVADNRVSMLEAIRTRKPKARIDVKPQRPERSLAGLALVAGALLAVGALVALTPGPAETEDSSVRSRLNSRGQMTQLIGPDPRSVLEAYCRSKSSDTERVVLRVTASGDTWTGFYRQQGTVYAISIRENPRTRQWVVGNAVDPVLPTQTSLQPRKTIPSR